jgi:hypothetical protein
MFKKLRHFEIFSFLDSRMEGAYSLRDLLKTNRCCFEWRQVYIIYAMKDKNMVNITVLKCITDIIHVLSQPATTHL